jgi:hypothetical protein
LEIGVTDGAAPIHGRIRLQEGEGSFSFVRTSRRFSDIGRRSCRSADTLTGIMAKSRSVPSPIEASDPKVDSTLGIDPMLNPSSGPSP